MAASGPPHLTRLLAAPDAAARARCWKAFVERYSRLVLSTCRAAPTLEYDDVMDRYAFVLEQLAADDLRRLRSYEPDGKTRFSTWLVVVVRRLCVDHHRRRYGRLRGDPDDDGARAAQVVRRRLADLLPADVDPARLPHPDGASVERRLVAEELDRALSRAVAGLPAEDRLLLALRFEHNATAADLGAVMGYPSRFHAYRALKQVLARLRASLEEDGFGTAARGGAR